LAQVISISEETKVFLAVPRERALSFDLVRRKNSDASVMIPHCHKSPEILMSVTLP
jgi:hypothetical protein